MSQREEYELERGDHTYQLDVTYEYKGYPLDEEGCPIISEDEMKEPMVIVLKAEVLAEWDVDEEGGPAQVIEYAGPDYPTLELTAPEVREFDEYLADMACPNV